MNAMKNLSAFESRLPEFLGLVSLLNPETRTSYQKYIHLQEQQICQVSARRKNGFARAHVCTIVKPKSLQVE